MHDDLLSYKSTPDLPDDEGKALLAELNKFWSAIDYDENNKKRRQDSPLRRSAESDLRKALLDAGARFKRHETFTAWLDANLDHHLEAYDPLRASTHLTEIAHDLRYEFDELKRLYGIMRDHQNSMDKLLREIVVRLPPEKAK